MNADIYGKKPSHPTNVDKLWITAQLVGPSFLLKNSEK
jgi:hypothetical protein